MAHMFEHIPDMCFCAPARCGTTEQPFESVDLGTGAPAVPDRESHASAAPAATSMDDYM
eukprot:SAG11_NODE_4161_length_2031_cov_1.683747_1_plen_59_part_00